jgi:hypothetical protein
MQNKVCKHDAAQYSEPVSTNIRHEHWNLPEAIRLRAFFFVNFTS